MLFKNKQNKIDNCKFLEIKTKLLTENKVINTWCVIEFSE